jgi:hypothetical protein
VRVIGNNRHLVPTDLSKFSPLQPLRFRSPLPLPPRLASPQTPLLALPAAVPPLVLLAHLPLALSLCHHLLLGHHHKSPFHLATPQDISRRWTLKPPALLQYLPFRVPQGLPLYPQNLLVLFCLTLALHRNLSLRRILYLVFVSCLVSCLHIASRVLSSYRVLCVVFVSRLVSCLRTMSCHCFVSCPHLAPCPCLTSCLCTAPHAPSSYRVACLIFVLRLVFVFHPIFVLVPCLASTTTPHSPRLVPHSSPLATVADLPPTRLNFTAAWPGLAHVSSVCHKHFTLMLTSLHWYRSNLTSKPMVRPLLARDTS